MTPQRLALPIAALVAGASLAGCGPVRVPSIVPAVATGPVPTAIAAADSLTADLDAIFDDPILDRAVMAVRVESLADGRAIYSRHAGARVFPASALKIVTAAVAAERLGWDHRFDTRLEMTGQVVDGRLDGDLIVVGSGDPTIAARDLRTAPLFEEWAERLRGMGIERISGRIVGDDNGFDDEPLGAGWAWDYLTAGYAAPSGALSYNENVVVVRVTPGEVAGAPARVDVGPPGHGLEPASAVVTAETGTPADITIERRPGTTGLVVRGRVPTGAAPIIRTTTVENPTLYFVEALRLALATYGIGVGGGAVDVDDISQPPGTSRTIVATHHSAPLGAIVAEMMKRSQNFYGEMLIKAVGRSDSAAGSTALGREVVAGTLGAWGVPDLDALVMYDGSGLSRYDYVTAGLLTGVLRHVWHDERLRGPFVAALPVSGHDGTLGARMSDALRRRVQAKTGTIANVRSLAGYLETSRGERLVFTMIANHFMAPTAGIDALMEAALERLMR